MVEIISLKTERRSLAELPSEGERLCYGMSESDLYPRHWRFLCSLFGVGK